MNFVTALMRGVHLHYDGRDSFLGLEIELDLHYLVLCMHLSFKRIVFVTSFSYFLFVGGSCSFGS